MTGFIMDSLERQTENNSMTDDIQRPESRKRKPWRRLLKILLIFCCSVVGVLLLLMGAVSLILTPPRLTPLVNKYASRYLQADVRFDTVRLSLFKHFPNVGVQIKGGEVLSRVFSDLPDSLKVQVPQRADSLLRFDEFTVVLNAGKLMLSRVDIRLLRLVHPQAYAYVAPWGKANWEIYDSLLSPEDTTAAESGDLYISVRRLDVRDAGDIVYESRPDSLKAKVELAHLLLKGKRQQYTIDMQSRNTVELGRIRYCDTLSLGLSGGFRFDTLHRGTFSLESLAVTVAGMPVVFDGTVSLARDSILSDVTCRIGALDLSRIISLVPRELMPRIHNFDTDLTLALDTHVSGTYNFTDGRLPMFSLDCRIDGGHLYYKDARMSIDNLELDASAYYHPLRPDSTGVELRKLIVEGSGIKLDAHGTAWDVMRDAAVKGCLKGDVNLTRISEIFPLPQGIVARGAVDFDVDGDLRLSQLDVRKLGQAYLTGTVCLHDLLLDMPSDTIRLMADHTDITFGAGANKTDSLIGKDTRMIRFGLKSDTLNLNLKNSLQVVAAATRLNMHSAASVLSGDTTVVHPFTGTIESGYLELNGQDSTWVKSYDASTRFSILPSPADPSVPLLKLAVGSMELDMRDTENMYQLTGSDVTLEATLAGSRRQVAARREHMLDSLQTVYPAVPRDSLFAHYRALHPRTAVRVKDDFASSDIDLKVDESISAMLRRWNVKGHISSILGRVVTPYFPLKNSLENVNIDFTTDDIKFYGTKVYSGDSQLELTGYILNLRRALLGRGPLKVDMLIESDTLNLNQLTKAGIAGVTYMEKGEDSHRALMAAASEEHLQELISAEVDTAAVESPLIVIPANVEMNLGLYVRHGIYADLVLSELSGELVMKDRCLQLRDFKAVTSAGEMDLTALYATRSRDDIMAGFDLEMKKVQVDKLIALVPSVDTLLPMLRSFEGVVDCQLAATAAMDTAMNFILPTLNGVGRIHGENMVLLDGETFAEIAKMMKFKNRKRNLIDKISVEMLIRDNQIEMFPFVIEMDRYKAAVSGIQKLDMSFDYHISVLKSPIPFRLGVNIFGNPDKFKFRIGRARYRNENIPTYVELIDTTRLNLRRSITDIFRRGIEAATLGELTIKPKVPSPADMEVTGIDSLTAADSLQLQREGILPSDSLSADSLGGSALAVDSLKGTGAKALKPENRTGKVGAADSKPEKPSAEERRKQKALLREERRNARKK